MRDSKRKIKLFSKNVSRGKAHQESECFIASQAIHCIKKTPHVPL